MKQHVMLFEDFKESLNEAKDYNFLRWRMVVTTDWKYAGKVDFVKGDKLAIELNSEGDSVKYKAKDVYVIDMDEEDIIDIMIDHRPPGEEVIDGDDTMPEPMPKENKAFFSKYFKGHLVNALTIKEADLGSFEYLEECINEGTTPQFKKLMKRAKSLGIETDDELRDLIADEFDDEEAIITGADYEIARKKLKLESLANSSVEDLNEAKKVQYKRQYTENHPSKSAGLHGRVRDKILEVMADKKMSQVEFDKIVAEFNLSKRWVRNNSSLFKVKGGMVALSETGSRIWKARSRKVNEAKEYEMSEDDIRQAMAESGKMKASDLMKYMKSRHAGKYDPKVAKENAKELADEMKGL